ncbi:MULTISPECIES: acetyl-CoA carboxylase biotin carboxyl carrier protein [unclassified Nocardiopsis]|uniref:acetyl-CoA carboxylase biotin carboxyl carrier protein n=1 Tax=Nocardiopsis TaxID=2013 RepID=UPI00387B927A
MTSAIEHNGTDRVLGRVLPDPAPGNRQLTLSELREEAELLISGLGSPVRRVSLRAGVNAVEIDLASPEDTAAPAVPASGPAAPAVVPAAAAVAPPPAGPEAPAGPTVRAPLVGTVYLAPEPGAEPFVAVGDRVSQGQQLAIVEAMKLMNPIVADRDGTIARIVAEDAAMVEFDAVLFELEVE